jgi:Iron-containing redox enzyme
MQSSLIEPTLGVQINTESEEHSVLETHLPHTPYDDAEKVFANLIEAEGLDEKLPLYAAQIEAFETTLALALKDAYDTENDDNAHRFLQRVLYRINRLNLFWYDDLQHYTNERSPYLHQVRDRIEQSWQLWESTQIDIASFQQLDVSKSLNERAIIDLDPPISANAQYMREEMSLEGYRYLLAIASFDGLVEASRLSRILGGAANEIQCTLVRVLLEEYGNGRLSRKHSTFFAQMMAELDLETQPEAYFDLVPWQVLASINHNFLLTECKQHFLRYNGGLTYFEVAGPSIYRTYLAAAQRLGLSDAAMGYWDLHIREDERHGRWMLDDVALPLAELYPNQAWQLVFGYDQEKWIGDRAAAAVADLIRAKEYTEPLPAH